MPMTFVFKAMTFLLVICFSLKSCGQIPENKTMKTSTSNAAPSLLEAVAAKDKKRVAQILETQPDLENKDHKGRTPLMIATYHSDIDIAEMLIFAGADVNAQDDLLNTPHLYAGANGNLSILKMTLDHGANFKIYNRYGGTALIPAAERRHLDIVKTLTEIPNYPIDHINKLGWTALLEAIILGSRSDVQVSVVNVLINAGADVNIPDNDGVSPLQHAKNMGMDEISNILKEANAQH